MINIPKQIQIIAVCSPHGGAGASSFIRSAGHCFAVEGFNVLVVDCNPLLGLTFSILGNQLADLSLAEYLKNVTPTGFYPDLVTSLRQPNWPGYFDDVKPCNAHLTLQVPGKGSMWLVAGSSKFFDCFF